MLTEPVAVLLAEPTSHWPAAAVVAFALVLLVVPPALLALGAGPVLLLLPQAASSRARMPSREARRGNRFMTGPFSVTSWESGRAGAARRPSRRAAPGRPPCPRRQGRSGRARHRCRRRS